MAPSLDFNATLAEQLRDAGMQMRAMTKPQKQRATPDVTPDATAGTAPETAHVTDAPAATPTTGATTGTTTATTVDATPEGEAATNSAPSARKNAHSARQDKAGQHGLDLGATLGKALAEASAEAHASEAAEAAVTRNSQHDSQRDSRGADPSSHADSHADSVSDRKGRSARAENEYSSDHSSHDTLLNSDGSRHDAQDSHHAEGATAHETTGAAIGATIGATTGPTTGVTRGAAEGVTTAEGVAATVRDAAAPAVTTTDTVTTTVAATPRAGVAQADGMTAEGTASSASVDGDGHGLQNSFAHSAADTSDTSRDNSPADTFGHQRQDSPHNTARNSEFSSHDISHGSNYASSGGALAPSVDGGLAPALPDAASELWAMSQHSEAPTLSERSWTGGVRGAVLDALRGLAGGRDHVLVNLKRLATHTGISYGSVRNAMSRLTRSGDIRTRQIRMADGHGVRVEFLTLPGQEGTGVAAPGIISSQAAVLGQVTALAQGMTQGMNQAPALAQGMTQGMNQAAGHMQGMTQGMAPTARPYGHEGYNIPQGNTAQGTPPAYGAQHAQSMHGDAPNMYAAGSHALTAQAPAQHTARGTVQHAAAHAVQAPAYGAVTMTAEQHAEGMTDYHTQGFTPVHGGEYGASMAHAPMTPAPQGMTPMQQPYAPPLHSAPLTSAPSVVAVSPSAPATFWDTADSLFALAWPHVAAAGLHMEHLRALAPIFTVQGFDPAVLPRTLRYLDWELEQKGMPEDMDDTDAAAAPASVMEAARQLTQSYLRAMQRRGTWPRPLGYEEGDD